MCYGNTKDGVTMFSKREIDRPETMNSWSEMGLPPKVKRDL